MLLLDFSGFCGSFFKMCFLKRLFVPFNNHEVSQKSSKRCRLPAELSGEHKNVNIAPQLNTLAV